jgi:transcriptional regulator with XRE-family HTH domain
MLSQEKVLTQNKITGVLVRSARLRAEMSVDECAQILSCAPEHVERVEEGVEGLTLPQLESLARAFQVSLAYLIGEEELPEEENALDLDTVHSVMALRRKIIGVLLRQARTTAGRSLDEVAPLIGYTAEHLGDVELGEAEIPWVELEALAQELNIPSSELLAQEEIPDSGGNGEAHDLERLAHLPPGVREFVLQPINTPYLQVAMNLSRMPAETLRQIASGLLEITY